MGTVRTVCGDCGASITRGDIFCSRCGNRIDWGKDVEVRSPETVKAVPCAICGHVNQ